MKYNSIVNLVLSTAKLLGGRTLTDCRHADDPSCTGGVAAIAAYARSRSGDHPTLVLPQFDYESSFIQQHPLEWDTNRLIMSDLLGWKLFLSRSWFISVEATQNRSVEGLQSPEWPLVISNIAVPVTNSWNHYTKNVFFDEETNLALISIVPSADRAAFDYPIIESTKAALDYIARLNMELGCQEEDSKMSMVLIKDDPEAPKACWIPVVVVDINTYDPSNPLLENIADYKHPPALYVDYRGSDPNLDNQPRRMGNGGVWAMGFRSSWRNFEQIQIEVDQKRSSRITNITFEAVDITEPLPEAVKDETYISHIATLRQYADEAIANDPVVGASLYAFPFARKDNIRQCLGGECVQGNMFTDAYRWFTKSDFAFENSGAYHGAGWSENHIIKVSDLWTALPFSNTICTGEMLGISVYNLFQASMTKAALSGLDEVERAYFLQVSGIRVTYNTELTEGNWLVALDIWNTTTLQYQPVERLRKYKFATNSYLCRFSDPFNQLTGPLLTLPGEVAGTVGYDAAHEVVASYLTQLGRPYEGKLEGRLVDDTSNVEPLNFIQTEFGCGSNSYWSDSYQTCFQCPLIEGVVLTLDTNSETLVFEGVSGDPTIDSGSVLLENFGDFPVQVKLQTMPDFLSYIGSDSALADGNESEWATLRPNTTLTLPLGATTVNLDAGTALGEVSIAINDGGTFERCPVETLWFDVEVKVLPQPELNQLGNIRILGLVLAGIVMLTSCGFAGWCLFHRNHHVVRVMQPIFLVTICSGVFIMGSALIPMSVDDQIASVEGAGNACMSIPWLMGIGFTVSFSALFSKLWRINRLFSQGLRRVTVREVDVLYPFAILLSAMIILLLTWTLYDPLRFTRVAVVGEPWSTYGICRGEKPHSFAAFTGILGAIVFFSLCLACYQAYKARNISGEYSESTYIGIAVFSWIQFFMVGVPVILVIDDSNTRAEYCGRVCLLFAVCMSLLLWIFGPLGFQHWNKRDKSCRQSEVTVTGLRGSSVTTSLTKSATAAAAARQSKTEALCRVNEDYKHDVEEGTPKLESFAED